MKKKCFIFVASSIFTLAALAGCSSGKNYDPNNFLPNGTQDNPYRIVTNPVTISIFAPKSTSNPEFETMKMFTHLSKITGLNFKFTTPAAGDSYNTQRAAAWNDKSSLPDLFLFNNDISDQVKCAEKKNGQYTPFNDPSYKDSTGDVGNLIENYMPNYKALLDNNFNLDPLQAGNAKDIATVSDGKMYSTLCAHDVPRDMTYKFWINERWISNCYMKNGSYCRKNGISSSDKITTIEQYIGVLTDFKNYDANNNGRTDDEIPATSTELKYFRNYILASQGYVTDGIQLERDGSKFTFVPLTDAYREYLKLVNALYKDGLLDNNSYSNTDYNSLAKNGTKGLLGSFEAAAPYLVTGQGDFKEKTTSYRLDKAYSPLMPLTSSNNSTPMHWGFGYFTPDGATIPTTSVYKREVARLLDIMYSELGQQLIAYGVENEDWTWDNAEKTSWTFNVPSSWTGSQEDYRATITPNVGTGSALYWSDNFVGKMNDDVITKLNADSSKYNEYLYVPVPSKYKFTTEQYSSLATITANININLPNLESQFVKGSKDPNNDADWNKFKEDITKYATDQLTRLSIEDIYNSLLK